MPPRPPRILSDDDLTYCLERIPWKLLEAVPRHARQFVVERLKDPGATDAAILRRAKCNTKVPKLPSVVAAVQASWAKAAEEAQSEAARVIARLTAIAFADPNEIVSHRRGACRYCYGEKHLYHYTPAEFAKAVETWEGMAVKSRGPDPKAQGGVGYQRNREPHPDCPECFGDGIAVVHIVDTRRMSKDAAVLYAGAKETDKGIEVKLRDQDANLSLLAKVHGLLNEKPQAPEDAAAAAARIRAALDEMDATVPRAA